MREMKDNIFAVYERGYKDGKADAVREIDHEEDYQRGLNDAWAVAKKIIIPHDDGGLAYDELLEIFGVQTFVAICDNYTISEAIAKIREWEEKKAEDGEIKVGDEIEYVYAGDKNKGVVLQVVNIDDGGYKVLCENGCGQIVYKTENPRKTGKHYQQIAEVLEQMREVNNG